MADGVLGHDAAIVHIGQSGRRGGLSRSLGGHTQLGPHDRFPTRGTRPPDDAFNHVQCLGRAAEDDNHVQLNIDRNVLHRCKAPLVQYATVRRIDGQDVKSFADEISRDAMAGA